MRIAESTSRRPLVVLSALALGTLVAATWPCDAPTTATTKKSPPRAMRGCPKRVHAPPAPAPAPVKTGTTYADVLRGAADALSACITPQHAQMRLELTIAETGRVKLWQVNVEHGDFEGIDADAMACLQQAVDPLQFPTGKEVRVSTHLIPRK